MKFHVPGELNNRNSLSPRSGGYRLKIQVWAVWVPFEAMRETPSTLPPSSWESVGPLQCPQACRCTALISTFISPRSTPCVHVCVLPLTSSHLNKLYLQRPYLQIRSLSKFLGFRTSTFVEDTRQHLIHHINVTDKALKSPPSFFSLQTKTLSLGLLFSSPAWFSHTSQHPRYVPDGLISWCFDPHNPSGSHFMMSLSHRMSQCHYGITNHHVRLWHSQLLPLGCLTHQWLVIHS